MRIGSGGFGYPTLYPDAPKRFRCGDCCGRGRSGLCLRDGIANARRVPATARACEEFQCSFATYERLTADRLF